MYTKIRGTIHEKIYFKFCINEFSGFNFHVTCFSLYKYLVLIQMILWYILNPINNINDRNLIHVTMIALSIVCALQFNTLDLDTHLYKCTYFSIHIIDSTAVFRNSMFVINSNRKNLHFKEKVLRKVVQESPT